jgi:hypothetical protein
MIRTRESAALTYLIVVEIGTIASMGNDQRDDQKCDVLVMVWYGVVTVVDVA